LFFIPRTPKSNFASSLRSCVKLVMVFAGGQGIGYIGGGKMGKVYCILSSTAATFWNSHICHQRTDLSDTYEIDSDPPPAKSGE